MSKPISVLLLAAGYGSRLKPYTNMLPKCLMPIKGKPLLEYWLETIKKIRARTVLVNTHYLSDIVQSFIDRSIFNEWVKCFYESELYGTAGTLRVNQSVLQQSTVLLAHADNFCQCYLDNFIRFHENMRPKDCPITMMTFTTRTPSACGIVELDDRGVVIGFHEKVDNPPGNLANGAVYLLEPEVLQWICDRPNVTDFSNQVLPHFIGRIATWHNGGVHIDIGTVEALREAQAVAQTNIQATPVKDAWSLNFSKHAIHKQLSVVFSRES
jgi:mannose-1-phosphate guanylyltransferase